MTDVFFAVTRRQCLYVMFLTVNDRWCTDLSKARRFRTPEQAQRCIDTSASMSGRFASRGPKVCFVSKIEELSACA
jgi:hypothetical protein